MDDRVTLDDDAVQAFGVPLQARSLGGIAYRTFFAGEIVLRRIPGDPIARHVAAVPQLEQMLVRVALRQLVGVVQVGDYRYVQEFVDAAEDVARLLGR